MSGGLADGTLIQDISPQLTPDRDPMLDVCVARSGLSRPRPASSLLAAKPVRFLRV
jgi:hypothetical protein